MPPIAQKNLLGSPAATDLGLGDQLTQQLQDQLAEKRKQAQLNNPINAAAGGASGLGLIGGSVSNLMSGTASAALGLG